MKKYDNTETMYYKTNDLNMNNLFMQKKWVPQEQISLKNITLLI